MDNMDASKIVLGLIEVLVKVIPRLIASEQATGTPEESRASAQAVRDQLAEFDRRVGEILDAD